jgi:hypothetical protein
MLGVESDSVIIFNCWDAINWTLYDTHQNNTVSDLEKNSSIKLNIHYVFYGSMWFILPYSTQ